MPKEPKPLESHQPLTDDQIRSHTIGEPRPLNGPVLIVDYDAQWPELFAREAERIRAVLGDRVVRLEHTGSTSVPGLAAKPIIDVLLVVTDSADEAEYLPPLEAAGYSLRIREIDWYEHRMLKGPDTDVNLHVFSSGCVEIDRLLMFRDWLRTHPRRPGSGTPPPSANSVRENGNTSRTTPTPRPRHRGDPRASPRLPVDMRGRGKLNLPCIEHTLCPMNAGMIERTPTELARARRRRGEPR